jgi:hypothetical protein
MSILLSSLPAQARSACEQLQNALEEIIAADLLALWVHGAVTFPDRPRHLGDVDTHAVLARTPTTATTEAIQRAHTAIARGTGVEWDSWYILEQEARGALPPHYVLGKDIFDTAWALHRAHWLAGQYVLLAGLAPSDLVLTPSWGELQASLLAEVAFMEQVLADSLGGPGHAAFVVWNACRILYSLETRNVVVSKRTAAHWALERLPSEWHPAIRAAENIYDGQPAPEDAVVLKACMVPFTALVRSQFPIETELK